MWNSNVRAKSFVHIHYDISACCFCQVVYMRLSVFLCVCLFVCLYACQSVCLCLSQFFLLRMCLCQSLSVPVSLFLFLYVYVVLCLCRFVISGAINAPILNCISTNEFSHYFTCTDPHQIISQQSLHALPRPFARPDLSHAPTLIKSDRLNPYTYTPGMSHVSTRIRSDNSNPTHVLSKTFT